MVYIGEKRKSIIALFHIGMVILQAGEKRIKENKGETREKRNNYFNVKKVNL